MSTFIIYFFVGTWLFLSLLSLYFVQKIMKKYKSLKKIEMKKKWMPFQRNDFKKWDKTGIIVGCFVRFPYKFGMLFIGTIGVAFVVLISSLCGKVGQKIQNLYIRKVARFFLGRMIKIKQKYDIQPIETPFVIANHINWIDSLYVFTSTAPASFIAKAVVRKIPFMGYISQKFGTIFINRESKDARNSAVSQISDKVKQFYYETSKGEGWRAKPIIVFPEGTTSNGKFILRFKLGAFNDLAPITMFYLKYYCQNFEMGMSTITQLQHMFLSMCQSPSLTVSKVVVHPLKKQNPEKYAQRVQKIMAEESGLKIIDSGFRQKLAFQQTLQG